jgi:hypothetical protein
VASVPETWRDRVRIDDRGSDVVVTVRAPAVLPGAGRWLQVQARSGEVVT